MKGIFGSSGNNQPQFHYRLTRRYARREHYSAIVLSGGAARGAYEIGAWTVLRRHGYNFDGFAGTSVGALNATLMAQNDFDVASDLWNNISLQDLLILPAGMDPGVISQLSLKSARALYREIVHKGGLDTSPLLNMIRKLAREDEIRKSGRDLALVSFAIPQLRPVKLFLRDMEPGRLPEYLYASASFPFLFRSAKIEEQRFTDGGVNDNLPAGMMQERGYRDLVLIDISAAGITHRPKMENNRLLYIKNSRPLPPMMDFRQSSIQTSRIMGELDTRRILGELDGSLYYIDTHGDPDRLLGDISGQADRFPREDLSEEFRTYHSLPVAVLESAALAYGLEINRVYDVEEMADAIRKKDHELSVQIAESAGRDESISGSTIAGVLMIIAREKMGDKSLLKSNPPMLWLMAAPVLLPKYQKQIGAALKLLYPELQTAEALRRLIIS